jgi:phi13 family phage major tail protein
MPINQSEYRQVIGLDELYIAAVTQDDADGFAVGAPQKLAPVAEASATPATESQTQYFDNQPFDTLQSEGDTEIVLKISNLPAVTHALITGDTYDAASGRVLDSADGNPPYYALGFRAKKANGSYRYFWYLKGTFNKPKDEAATQKDSPDPKTVELAFIAIKTVYKWTINSVAKAFKRVWGDEDSDNFSETGWFSSVQIPVEGSPSAFSLSSSSPADGATGVVVTANITLTFSNALAGNAENGIVLIDPTTGAAIAAARTINAARTIVTINPTSSLDSATEYLIIIPGVTDVYGQSLADAVINFETA